MNKTIVYIGAYSPETGEGIYIFEMDPITGGLKQLFEPVHIENPSYLAFDKDKRFLYAVMETDKYSSNIEGGGVAAFQINGNGSLKFINKQPTFGACPCYLSVDSKNRFLLAANYGGGSMSVFPLGEDGSIQPCSQTVVHSGNGPAKGCTAHVHFTEFSADDEYIFAVDLGLDEVRFYKLDVKLGTALPKKSMTITCKPGSGPRHLVFRDDTAYIINELSSDIGVFTLEDGKFIAKQYISTTPIHCKDQNAPAALKISNDRKLLFASNRGHDSIAVCHITNDGLLGQVECFPSGGNGPRDFSMDPKENYMLVANEKSNQVNVLKINHVSNSIEPTELAINLYRPTCIKFGVERN